MLTITTVIRILEPSGRVQYSSISISNARVSLQKNKFSIIPEYIIARQTVLSPSKQNKHFQFRAKRNKHRVALYISIIYT